MPGKPAETIRWIAAAARYGLVEGQLLLGQCLLDGKGLPRDPRAALRWFDAIAVATDCLRAAALGATPDVVRLVAGTLLQSREPAMRHVGYIALKRLACCEGAAQPERERGEGARG